MAPIEISTISSAAGTGATRPDAAGWVPTMGATARLRLRWMRRLSRLRHRPTDAGASRPSAARVTICSRSCDVRGSLATTRAGRRPAHATPGRRRAVSCSRHVPPIRDRVRIGGDPFERGTHDGSHAAAVRGCRDAVKALHRRCGGWLTHRVSRRRRRATRQSLAGAGPRRPAPAAGRSARLPCDCPDRPAQPAQAA